MKPEVAVVAVLLGWLPAMPSADESRLALYESLYPHFPDESGNAEANERARYAWVVSYHALADVRMYQATGDRRHLDRALGKFVNILAHRDDRRGVKDFQGRSRPVWRNIHYQLPEKVEYKLSRPDNDRYAYGYAVHSGMILYPMVTLAEEIVRRRPPGNGPRGLTYRQWADEIVARSRETVAAHEEEWSDYGADEGFYRFADFPPYFANYRNRNRDVPFNQSHTLGSAMVVLYRLTGDNAYRDKASRLAVRFKRSIAVSSDGASKWNYWQPPGTYSVKDAGEDISHASLNVNFAYEAFRAGLVFDERDLRSMARTLARVLLRETQREAVDHCGKRWLVPDVSDAVGGGARVNRYWAAAGRWLELTGFAPEAWPAVCRLLDYAAAAILCGKPADRSTSILLGHALAILHKPTPQTGQR